MHLAGWLFSLGLLASTAKVINFDTFPLGKTPPGWSVAMTSSGTAPRWEILKDGTAPTQPYVLAQVSPDSNDSRTALAILNDVSLRDGDVTVRVKPVAGHKDQGGGVVWRYLDENNYYFARADALLRTVSVFKVQNGRRIPLVAGIRHEIPLNGWCILKISARGDRFQVYLDHRRVAQGQDRTFTGAGKVGLCTGSDSITYFDDFRVYPK